MKNLLSLLILIFLIFNSLFAQNNFSLERRIISKIISSTNEYNRTIQFLKSSDFDNFYRYFPIEGEVKIFNSLKHSNSYANEISYKDFINEMELFNPTRSLVNSNIIECRNVNFDNESSGTVEVIVNRSERYFSKNNLFNPLNIVKDGETIYEEIPYTCDVQLVYKWKFTLKSDFIIGEMGLRSSVRNNDLIELELVRIFNNNNPISANIYYPTFKNNPIAIDDYKKYFSSNVNGLNLVWSYQEFKDVDLTSDFKFKSKESKKDEINGFYSREIREKIPFNLTFTSTGLVYNEFITSQESQGLVGKISVDFIRKSNFFIGSQLNISRGTNIFSLSDRTYSFNAIDPDNYNYIRNISLKNFSETIDSDFTILKVYLGYKLMDSKKITISGNLAYNQNISSQIFSSRDASISYSGSYPYLYNITIKDNIYDFGKYEVNQSSEIDIEIVNPVTLGLNFEYSLNKNISILVLADITTDFDPITLFNNSTKFQYFSQNPNELFSIFEIQNSYIRTIPFSLGLKFKI